MSSRSLSTACLLYLLLLLLWVGLWNNELLYKGAAVVWFCLARLYAAEWCHAGIGRKILLSVFLLLSASDAYGQLVGGMKSFTVSSAARQHHCRNEWQGNLHRPNDKRSAQFSGNPLLPNLFKF